MFVILCAILCFTLVYATGQTDKKRAFVKSLSRVGKTHSSLKHVDKQENFTQQEHLGNISNTTQTGETSVPASGPVLTTGAIIGIVFGSLLVVVVAFILFNKL